MGDYEDTRKVLKDTEAAFQEEVEQLNRMAEEAMLAGNDLGKDAKLLEQSKRTDEMILDIQHLKAMLAEYDAKEAGGTEE